MLFGAGAALGAGSTTGAATTGAVTGATATGAAAGGATGAGAAAGGAPATGFGAGGGGLGGGGATGGRPAPPSGRSFPARAAVRVWGFAPVAPAAGAPAVAVCWVAAEAMWFSIRLRIFASRAPADVPPSTTATTWRLLRCTDVTRLNPDAWV